MIYASFSKRALACIIDWAAAAVIVLVMSLFLNSGIILTAAIVVFFCLGWGLLFLPFLESSRYQATIGKLAAGIKVAGYNNEKISFKQAFFRNLLKSGQITGLAPFLFIVCRFTPRRQNMHDLAAETIVIDAKAGTLYGKITSVISYIWPLVIIALAVYLYISIFSIFGDAYSAYSFYSAVSSADVANMAEQFDLSGIVDGLEISGFFEHSEVSVSSIIEQLNIQELVEQLFGAPKQ